MIATCEWQEEEEEQLCFLWNVGRCQRKKKVGLQEEREREMRNMFHLKQKELESKVKVSCASDIPYTIALGELPVPFQATTVEHARQSRNIYAVSQIILVLSPGKIYVQCSSLRSKRRPVCKSKL